MINYRHIYHRFFVANISSFIEPTTFAKATKDPVWTKPMNLELQALQQNDTWAMTSHPPEKTPIGCKWVYKKKYKSDGNIERYKACLVAKGYTSC